MFEERHADHLFLFVVASIIAPTARWGKRRRAFAAGRGFPRRSGHGGHFPISGDHLLISGGDSVFFRGIAIPVVGRLRDGFGDRDFVRGSGLRRARRNRRSVRIVH
jgi:hypothetical protein